MSKQIVEQAKADLLKAGKDLSGNNGAFLIVMEAASRIPGMGVVDKPSGNHAEFEGASYSVDGMMNKAGAFFDCLIDGGGANTPTFDQGENIDPARWRPAKAVIDGGGQTGLPNPDVNTLLKSFLPAAANSMDVGHASLREIHVKLDALRDRLLHIEDTVAKALQPPRK